MFAVRNNFMVVSNAGRGLALILQAFFMSAYIVVFRYWYSCTPVYRLNGRTAFVDECDKQRDRHGYLLFLLCVITSTFPTLHCLAATERQPTKLAHKYSIRTHSVHTTPRASVVANRHILQPCDSSSLPCSPQPMQTSVASRSRTPAFFSAHVSGCTVAESSINRHIPCRTSTDYSMRMSASCLHNPLITQVLNLGCTPLRWGVQGLLYT